MNAFTRQEISAVHLTRKTRAGQAEQRLPGRQLTYLPIVHARSGRIIGYQADAGADGGIIDCLRRQLMNSPACGLLLMELEAADCLQKNRCQANHMCALFSQEAWTERELVIHLRYGQDGSAWQVTQMQKRLQAQGVGFAVSWDGCPSLLSMDALIDARLIRFEASALETDDDAQARVVLQVMSLAHALGIQTLLAGVSDGEQVEKARKLGFDWLQGPLFNRLKCAVKAAA